MDQTAAATIKPQSKRRLDLSMFVEVHSSLLIILVIVVEVLLGSAPAAIEAGAWALGGDSWFRSPAANHMEVVTVILVAFLIPLVTGIVAKTWWWVWLFGTVAEGTVLVGSIAGLILARQVYPERWATRSANDFIDTSVSNIIIDVFVIALAFAAAPAAISALTGTLFGKARFDAWDRRSGWKWELIVIGSLLFAAEIWLIVKFGGSAWMKHAPF